MLGFFIHALTAPLYYGVKAASRAGRSSGRSYRPRAPRYSHGYCTIAHRSEGAAQRCATTAAYRRVEAAGIAADREREREAAYREIARRAALAEQRAIREARRQRRHEFWAQHRNLARLIAGIGVVLTAALVMSVLRAEASAPTPAAASAIAPSAPNTATSQPTSLCDSPYSYRTQSAGPYDGNGGCWPGETVTVARFIDAATFELTDGRRVRLAGLVIRSPNTCGGAAALKETRDGIFGFKEGQQVNMIREPNAGTDPFGAQWAYIQGDQGHWMQDLGQWLASAGYAEPLPNSGANSTYLTALADTAQSSKGMNNGQWGPPCGPPAPDDGAPIGSGSSTHVDVDHHHNLPDGLLTGGFCRHRRWC